MKISGFWAGAALVLASAASCGAQVTVEVTQDQQQFLPGESLKVAVRITNLSGQELHLGGEEDWLTFALESREGVVVPKLGEAPVLGGFSLESSKVAIKRLDLAPYYQLTRPGTYQIVATLRIRDWNKELISPPKSFDVIQGVKLWEQEVGVPGPPGSPNSQPETRRYILQQANYIRGQIRLYVRVTDSYGKPIRVFAVGPMVSFGRPDRQVDKFNNLHVLCQDGAASFNYTVCNLDGDVILRRTYDFADSRPRLRMDDEGKIVVAGGARRITSNDVPPSEDSSEPAPPAASDSKPTASNVPPQLGVARPSP